MQEKDVEQDKEIKYLEELNNSLQETILDGKTEIAKTVVVNDSVEGIGRINVHGGQRQESREGYNKLDFSNYTVSNLENTQITQNYDMSIDIKQSSATSVEIRKVFDIPLILKKGTYTFDFGVASTSFNVELNLNKFRKRNIQGNKDNSQQCEESRSNI